MYAKEGPLYGIIGEYILDAETWERFLLDPSDHFGVKIDLEFTWVTVANADVNDSELVGYCEQASKYKLHITCKNAG